MYANSASFKLANDFLNDIKQKINRNHIDYLLTDYFKKAAEGCGMKSLI